MDSNSTHSAMNRLAKEKSPYLLQHAHNPVDWYPWDDEAFKKARAENKPVFLSIGYATCHWCHVMEHESFEDEEIASMMNEAFVNIKVDREERPDIDHTYMTVCQMMTGRGGWPLTIVMTPEKEPFFAATYLPRDSRSNIMGMADFIPRIREAWEKDTKRVHEAVERIKAGFTKSLELGTSGGTVSENVVKKAEKSLQNQFDPEHGGFGEAPKFPSPHNLIFLLNRYRTEKDDSILKMADTTLEKMRLGGLWDQIGRGFHRYSTDSDWLLPHFEKMLYDQAMMLMAYTEGYALTQNILFKKTALDIVEYTDECLASPEGAFYSAEDADSEGEEGKFYIWEKREIEEILPDDDARLFCELFGIQDEGNFHDESTRQKTGANIPHLQKQVSEEQTKRVQHILEELHTHRKKRIRPLLDDKILTDWNGLMIAALARSGVVLNSSNLIEKAKNAWSVLKKHCLTPNGELHHRYKDGEAEIEGMADDYAFTIWGLLELYNATFEPDYLSDAISLQKSFYKDFWDTEHSGYFFTSRSAEKLLGRQKEIYDGAIPSSNSVAILNGFRLSRLTGNPKWENHSQKIPGSFSAQIDNAPVGFCFALYGFEIMNSNLMEIVICTPEIDSITEKFVQLCRDHAPPHSAILVKTKHQETSLNKHAPFVTNYPVKDRAAAYVCRNFECKQPVYTPEDLMAVLSE